MSQAVRTDIETLLELFNKWRHIASYQLEPRVDALFAMFFPVVFAKHLNVEIYPEVIPQFPLKKSSENNEAFRADFIALSKDGTQAYFVEIKTDMTSRNPDQDRYLGEAMARGPARILAEFKEIAKASDKGNRLKYFHIMSSLSDLGVIDLPCNLEDTMYAHVSRGVFDLIDEVEVRPPHEFEIVYIQPEDYQSSVEGTHYINFEQFAEVITTQGETGEVFAKYLRKWACEKAGQVRPGHL